MPNEWSTKYAIEKAKSRVGGALFLEPRNYKER